MKTVSAIPISAVVGFKLHKGYSKMLKYNTKSTSPIILDGEHLEEVEAFTHLGKTIDKQGGSDEDMKARIGKVTTGFLHLKNTWNSRQPSRRTLGTTGKESQG